MQPSNLDTVGDRLRRNLTRARMVMWRGLCWLRRTHRASVVSTKPSPVPGVNGHGRRIVQCVCIHCGYSIEADLTAFQIPQLTDRATNTLKLGSRAKVPFKKRMTWLWADLKRVS